MTEKNFTIYIFFVFCLRQENKIAFQSKVDRMYAFSSIAAAVFTITKFFECKCLLGRLVKDSYAVTQTCPHLVVNACCAHKLNKK